MYSAGEFDSIITIKRKVFSKDGAGGRATSLQSLYSNIPAKLKSPSVDENSQAGKVNSGISVVFVLRRVSGLLEKDVIEHNGRMYNIIGFLPVRGRSVNLEIVAKAGGAV